MSADRLDFVRREVLAYLAANPRALTSPIASSIRRRPQDVRRVLQSDARIVEVAPPPGSKAAARAWALKDANGTGKDGQQTSDPGEYLPASGEALERLVRATVDRRLADVLEGLMSGPS